MLLTADVLQGKIKWTASLEKCLHKNDVKLYFFQILPIDDRQSNAAPVIVLLVWVFLIIHPILPEKGFFLTELYLGWIGKTLDYFFGSPECLQQRLHK